MKWVELIPLPSKTPKDSAKDLLEEVLSRFEALEEVLTDHGWEFMGGILESPATRQDHGL